LLYVLVFVPVFYIVPKLTMRNLESYIIKADAGSINDGELTYLVRHILRMPINAIKVTAVVTTLVFFIESLLWLTGIIPELMPLIFTAITETVVLGVVVAIYEGLVNYALFSKLASNALATIAFKYPQVLFYDDIVAPQKLRNKLRNIIILTIVAGELSVILFFMTLLSANKPEVVLFNLFVVVLLLVLTVIYTLVLSPAIAETYVGPLRGILDWGKGITEGRLDTRIRMVTRDELMTFVNGSNNAMDELETSIGELKESATLLAMDRDLIEGERNKLSVVVGGIEDGVLVINGQKQITMANSSIQSMLGWTEKELMGESVGGFLVMYENMKKIGIEELLAEGVDSKEVSVIRKDNSKRLVRVTIANIIDERIEGKTIMITIHDVSHEKEIEKMKIDFVSMAANELRTPLTSMKGYVSLLVNEENPVFKPEQQEFLERVDVAINELNTLVENLLSVTKIEQGGLQLNYDTVSWREFMDEIVREHAIYAEQKEITLTLTHPSSDVFAVVDRMRIKEVFNNLITNAIKYSQKKATINISYNLKDDFVITDIQDSGIGIPKEDIPKLFTKFYRVIKHTDKERGTGLGLYISKVIVDRHKGKIDVNSVEGQGSTFSVSLPLNHR